MELKMRKDVPSALTWDLSLIYQSEADLRKDMEKLDGLGAYIAEEYQGKLTSPETINACLDHLRKLYHFMSLTGSYCDLAVSVDYYDTHNQELSEEVSRLSAKVLSQISFVDTEIAAQEEETLKQAVLAATDNKNYLLDVLRNKPHKLTPETERALAALSPTIQSAPYQIYNMAKLADMKFAPFTANNTEYPLGYSLFEDNYEYEKD